MANVADGDCILSIADQLGFHDYHSIWDDAVNDTLRQNRPNPTQLVVNDVVGEPNNKTKVEKKAVDNTWTLVVKQKKPVQIRLVLLDNKGEPLSGKSWELTVPLKKKGKTGADGVVEFKEVAPDVTAGTLKVTMREATKTKPAADPPAMTASSTPKYPRPIKYSEFKDDKPVALDPADNVVEWDLKVGSLPSFNSPSGVKARLHNLGFLDDPAANGDALKHAVQVYQKVRLKQDAGSGLPDDIRANLRDWHDNP